MKSDTASGRKISKVYKRKFRELVKQTSYDDNKELHTHAELLAKYWRRLTICCRALR
jgi:hypothetical protein